MLAILILLALEKVYLVKNEAKFCWLTIPPFYKISFDHINFHTKIYLLLCALVTSAQKRDYTLANSYKIEHDKL